MKDSNGSFRWVPPFGEPDMFMMDLIIRWLSPLLILLVFGLDNSDHGKCDGRSP